MKILWKLGQDFRTTYPVKCFLGEIGTNLQVFYLTRDKAERAAKLKGESESSGVEE